MDDKLNEFKLTRYSEVERPVAAFITFEIQEGFERACEVKGYINWRN